MGKNQKNYDYSLHGTYKLPRNINEENRRFLKSIDFRALNVLRPGSNISDIIFVLINNMPIFALH